MIIHKRFGKSDSSGTEWLRHRELLEKLGLTSPSRVKLGGLRGVTLGFSVRRDDICPGGNEDSLEGPVWSEECVKGDGKGVSALFFFA